MRAPRGELLEFANWAATTTTDECVIWPYGVTTGGYGLLSIKGERVYAHRYVLQKADPSDGSALQVLHHPDPEVCFNRRCINPRHLRWGTLQENTDDRKVSGTDWRGEEHHCAKLTEAEARSILVDHRGPKALAEEYGVTPATICDLRKGRTWKHLTIEEYTFQ